MSVAIVGVSGIHNLNVQSARRKPPYIINHCLNLDENMIAAIMAQEQINKPVHTILLDAAPILLNTPSISTLTGQAHTLITTQSVVSELRAEEARTRFETLYRPFVEIRSPKPESVKFVRDFARRTGDLAVLSATDLEILALAYDLECERNHGDWRLRRVPGQKRTNGPKPEVAKEGAEGSTSLPNDILPVAVEQKSVEQVTQELEGVKIEEEGESNAKRTDETEILPEQIITETEDPEPSLEEEDSADSDSGWITPSNIKRKQAKDEGAANTSKEQKTLQVATMTGDFAMQNVLLQMNLNLLSTKTCKRIAHIKQTIFRCHACFQTTKDMSKQFCPRCGKPTLTRVTCTTNDKGEVKLHLKQNFQWNNRGNVFSVPKPTAGTANQKWKGPQDGGGKGGWGNGLILAEDQKEYVRAMTQGNRRKEKDLMDEDDLPGILTGERRISNRVQVGAGRNVNSRKKR